MTDIRQKLMASFEVEYREHLSAIRGMFDGSGDSGGGGAGPNLEEAYRHAHSLKGAARAVDLAPVESLSHRLETLFSRVQKGQLAIDDRTARVIQIVLDGIEDWMAALDDNPNPPLPVDVIAAIDGLLGIDSEAVVGAAAAVSPVAHAAADGDSDKTPSKRSADSETLRVRAESLDRMLRSSGQLAAEGYQHETLTRELRALSRKVDAIQRDSVRFRTAASGALRQLAEMPEYARIAVHTEAVDKQIRELSSFLKSAFRAQERNAWTFRQLVDELQASAREARMVPAENIFGGFRKMVRDLARDEGREVDIDFRGLQTEADRVILQSLKDPVMHLLRNSITHGIEPPAERKRRGKKPTGKVTLDVAARGGRLIIRVADDGQGVDPRRVAKVAVTRGILSEADAKTATPDALSRLLLRSGFSTTGKVTKLAGRGIGLSVAHQVAAQLQGTLDIQADDGPGMAVVISVPLSITNHRVLLCACQEGTYGFRTEDIERIHRVPEKDLISVEGKPMVRLEDRTLPVAHLSQLLGLPAADGRAEGEALPVAVLHGGGRHLAIAVDAFIAVRDTVIKSIGRNGTSDGKVAGAFALDDGSVALVVNGAGLIGSFTAAADHVPLKATAAKQERAIQKVLVVDDSITTRTLEKSILEAHGFQVNVSVDGVDALRRLRLDPADLVVADIQMPRMDGFVLLKELKRDKSLSRIPVILVTSCDSDDDRRRGLELGAEAYIIKQKFDQRELLETIRQLI